ncbi:hypothetical protein F0919_05105 [Taibaiella lutea]|uniref:Uncharacterized protein n=1 Tax=Taibaiella lutea TaxID=2608001 RepID=A0A5M6CPH0_9BACT|nr:hypothetical protein [Taibaiella lutea]KAA5537054.1 hypothetical protein F0919_05105 [Taibaiella lutea]
MKNLEDNNKLEYRYLYREMVKKGFIESFPISDEHRLKLPNGIYAMDGSSKDLESVVSSAKEAIERALYPFYDNGWHSKYTLIVTGPSPIISENLEQKNHDDSLYGETEDDDGEEE